MNNTQVTKALLFVLCIANCFGQHPLDAEAAKIPSANNPEEAVKYLIGSIDKSPGDQELLDALGIDSLDIFYRRLSTSTDPWPIFHGIDLLSYKYKQFEQKIDSAQKDKIVQLLVTRAEQTPKGLALDFLQGIDHPTVRSLAQKLKDSQVEDTRVSAEKLLRSFYEKPKAITATRNPDPMAPVTHPKDFISQPSVVQKPESSATLPTTTQDASNYAWLIWSITGILAVTLAAIYMRKRTKQL